MYRFNSRKCGGGCIAGAVIGSIVGFGALVGGAWYFRQYQNKSSDGGVEDTCKIAARRGYSCLVERRRNLTTSSDPTSAARQERRGEIAFCLGGGLMDPQNTPRELHERTEEDEVEEARGAKKSAKKGSQEKVGSWRMRTRDKPDHDVQEDSDEDDSHYYDV
eukprot:346951-Hanusia_phi.AAC.2